MASIRKMFSKCLSIFIYNVSEGGLNMSVAYPMNFISKQQNKPHTNISCAASDQRLVLVIQVHEFLFFELLGLFLHQLMSKNEVKLAELVFKYATCKYQKLFIN